MSERETELIETLRKIAVAADTVAKLKTCGEVETLRGIATVAFAAIGNPPYPEFCRHPDKCAGKDYCPREIACCD